MRKVWQVSPMRKAASPTRSAAEVSRATGAGTRDIDNWINRLELSTTFDATTQGVPRRYYKDNALELGFMAAMVRAGVAPSTANAYVRSLLDELKFHRRGQGHWRPWLVFPAGDAKRAYSTDSPDMNEFQQRFASDADDGAAPVLVVVPLQGIVDRVERLFTVQEPA
jgi:hypothetical protein